MSEALRESLVACAVAMQAEGLVVGTSGNLSARWADGFLITPSGLAYDTLKPADMVFVGDDGSVRGQWRPSSEWRIHQAVYQARPEAGAVLHAHPTYSTSLACLRRDIPAFHYEVALAGGRDIRCARYATFGTPELARFAVEALQDRTACLLANHGLLCLAADLPGALTLALRVEQLARIYCQCVQAGEPRVLDEEEMARVVRKFRSYGQQDTK